MAKTLRGWFEGNGFTYRSTILMVVRPSQEYENGDIKRYPVQEIGWADPILDTVFDGYEDCGEWIIFENDKIGFPIRDGEGFDYMGVIHNNFDYYLKNPQDIIKQGAQ